MPEPAPVTRAVRPWSFTAAIVQEHGSWNKKRPRVCRVSCPLSPIIARVSKLSDVIRKATRAEASRRLGFGTAAAPRPAPSLLCLVHLSAGDSHKAAEAVSQGAEAVILDGADPGKVKDQIRKAEKAVLGVRLSGKADR